MLFLSFGIKFAFIKMEVKMEEIFKGESRVTSDDDCACLCDCECSCPTGHAVILRDWGTFFYCNNQYKWMGIPAQE